MAAIIRTMAVGTLTLLFLVTSVALAGPPWWDSWKRDFHRNNSWPKPFLPADRVAVCTPFDQMVTNGWRRQNLLSEHHFDDTGRALTASGQLKIRWILTQVPPRYRTIFVERGFPRQITQTRMDTIQAFASTILPPGEIADVQETHIVEEGRSAAAIDSIYTRFQQSLPTPALPAPPADESN